jgi:hypothetical protein
MENIDLKEPSDYSDMASEGNSNNISDYSKKDFTASTAMSPTVLEMSG